MKKCIFNWLFFPYLFYTGIIHAQNCSVDTVQLQSQTQMLFSVPIGIVADRLNRPFCYVAGKEGGLSIFNISNIQAPQLVQSVSTALFDSLDIMYLFQDSIYLYVALGNFFGTVPEKPGMAILDISIPSNPQVLDFWEWPTVAKGASTVVVSGNYAYLAAMTQGVFILNISTKNNITMESNFIPDPNWPVMNPNAVQAPNARGMAYRNDTLFLCYDAGGLRVLDVSNKTNPIQIAQYLNPGSSGKQEAFNHIILDGGLAYIAEDYCGMEVVDISNASSISQVGWWNPWNCQLPATQWNGCPGHCNQMAFNQNQKIVYLSSGDSELRIIDVSNPALPDSCNGFGPVGNSKACWGVDVFNPNIYITYINSFIPFFSNWAGFKIVNWPLISGLYETPLEQEELTVTPNPVHDYFTLSSIQYSKFENKYDVYVYNSLGALCMRCNQVNPDEQIDCSSLQPGVYMLKAKNSNSCSSRKFVKQ